ncbi:hypothetical protein Bca4012_066878 [Brassica carinata]
MRLALWLDGEECTLMLTIITSIQSQTIVMERHFISADDLRINLWNLEISNQSFASGYSFVSASNLFGVFGVSSGSTETTTLEASKNPMRYVFKLETCHNSREAIKTIPKQYKTRGAESPGCDGKGTTFDHTTKLLHLAWHPTENLIACTSANSLYMYYA